MILLKDANTATIMLAICALRDHQIKDSSLVLIFFSVHGVECEGTSYLLPISIKSHDEEDLAVEAVSFDDIMRAVRHFTAVVNLMLLDCFRENDVTFKNGTTKGRAACSNTTFEVSFSKNLRSTRRNVGFVVGLACDPGTVALPNKASRTSRYTEALLPHLPVPGRELELSLKEVTRHKLAHTNNKQRPWRNMCRTESFILVPVRTEMTNARVAVVDSLDVGGNESAVSSDVSLPCRRPASSLPPTRERRF